MQRTLQRDETPSEEMTDDIMAQPRFGTEGLEKKTFPFTMQTIADWEANKILGNETGTPW